MPAFAARRKVSGLFLGPLTNLAKGLLEDPAAFRLWRPTVMAGAFTVNCEALPFWTTVTLTAGIVATTWLAAFTIWMVAE